MPQKPPSDVIAAGPGVRIKAFACDYLVIFVYLTGLALLGSFLTFGPLRRSWSRLLSTPQRIDLLAYLTTVLPVTLYFARSESSEQAATWGKRRVGIMVVGQNGKRLSLPRSLVRSAIKFLPWQLAHTAILHIPGFPTAPDEPPPRSKLLLAIVWVLVVIYLVGLTPLGAGRTLYDRIAGSQVVQAGTHQ
jgi:uncharacterized RDD family membrane protein YckC